MTHKDIDIRHAVARLTAESDIRCLVAAYSDAVWRLDADAFADCWAQDGEWHIFGAVWRGRRALTDHWLSMMSGMQTAWQITHTLTVEVDMDAGTALGRSHVNETVMGADGKPFIALGIYHDRYVRDGDRWLFAVRRWNLVHLGPPDVSGRWFDYPNPARPPHDPRPDRPTTPSAAELGFA